MMTLLRTSQVRTCEKSAKDYNCFWYPIKNTLVVLQTALKSLRTYLAKHDLRPISACLIYNSATKVLRTCNCAQLAFLMVATRNCKRNFIIKWRTVNRFLSLGWFFFSKLFVHFGWDLETLPFCSIECKSKWKKPWQKS